MMLSVNKLKYREYVYYFTCSADHYTTPSSKIKIYLHHDTPRVNEFIKVNSLLYQLVWSHYFPFITPCRLRDDRDWGD